MGLSRTAKPTAKAVAFFYRHAGYSYRKGKETAAQGRKRGAKLLAQAEAEAFSRGWRVEWEADPEPYDPGDTDYEPKEVFGAVLRDENGHVLESLWSIADPDRKFRRVTEAELALEALSKEGVL